MGAVAGKIGGRSSFFFSFLPLSLLVDNSCDTVERTTLVLCIAQRELSFYRKEKNGLYIVQRKVAEIYFCI
jgi:hypothetical protein